MKKLVGFTTIVLLVLVGILGAMVMRTNQRIGKEEVVSSIAEKIGSEEFVDSIKQKLSMETEAQVEEKSVDKDVPEYDYVDQLLRLNVQMETITYECNEFSLTFKNPFYEEGSENYVSVVFYDAEHGLLLKSIGKGTDSEFFEVYKTEDGCKTWNKTTEDITFSANGPNALSMISENEVVCVRTVQDEVLGIDRTEVSVSVDGGDTWHSFRGTTSKTTDDEVLAKMQTMNLHQKVDLLFMITPEQMMEYSPVTSAGYSTKDAIKSCPVAGLVFSEDNIDYGSQLRSLAEGITEYAEEVTGYPMLLAVTEEGGENCLITGNEDLYEDEGQIPSLSELASSTEEDVAIDAGALMAEQLLEYSLNTNLAPVADIAGAGARDMNSRSAGSDPAVVSKVVMDVMEGMQENNVLSCMKYFPGYASATDSETGFPVLSSSLEQMREKEFVPYKDAIAEGVDMIMVGHILIPEVLEDEKTPASLSKTMITTILREELGYNGVIVTDRLDDEAIQENYTVRRSAIKAIRAGADILFCPSDYKKAYKAVYRAVQKGRISEERLDQSVYRILSLKAKLKAAQEVEEETDIELE